MDVLPWDKIFTGKLFEGLNIIMGGSYCCRMGATHMGERDPPFNYLPTLVKNLAETGYKEIILYHDACYGLLTAEALSQMIEVPFKPVHYIESISCDYASAKSVRRRITSRWRCYRYTSALNFLFFF